MIELKEIAIKNGALIRPAPEADINALEIEIGFKLPNDYKDYLSKLGLISFESEETYGLGISKKSHLNVINIYRDLSSDKNYPQYSIPILDAGDGNYYLYDTQKNAVVLWATPNGGIVKILSDSLEKFLTKYIFQTDI